jgi:L-alanine-DL-glutamate epimerase-like enolase superfamily enzyme
VSSDCIDLAEQNPGNRGAERDVLWIGQPQVVDGYMQPSDEPGFGVRVNEAML